MKKKRVLVLTDTLPWGHRSIAKAIFGYLKKRERGSEYKVDYAEVKAETGMANDFYTFLYRFSPKLGGLTGILAANGAMREAFEQLVKLNTPGVKKMVEWMKPDLIISCYFFHSHSLARLKEEGAKFELWTVVADPWTTNRMSFVPGADWHLVYDEVGEKQAYRYGVKKGKVLKTGWWVREEMYDKKSQITNHKSQTRRKMGFGDDRPVIFIGGGSLGGNFLAKVLPMLMFAKKKVGVVFNTGNDKLAFSLVEEYIKLFKRIKRDDTVIIKNYGWIDNMGEVLAGCDMVFGKAGPNFLFDCVAVGKPMVAITHIGGQEDGNIELIRKKKLGWVREKSRKLTDFFLSYIEEPEKYNRKFAGEIKREGERNRKSLEKIRQKILGK